MATGFESYISLMYTNPQAAFPLASQHLQALVEKRAMYNAGDGPTNADYASLDNEIARVQKDLERLAGVVYRVGIPRIQPTRRVDNAPWPVPGQGQSQ